MKSEIFLIAWVANCAMLGRAFAQDDDLSAEELAEIESSLAADAQAAGSTANSAASSGVNRAGTASMNPDIGFVLDTAAAAFSSEQTLQTGAHDPFVSGFRLQQLEMSLVSNVDPFFRVNSNLVFTPEEGVDLEEAYATSLGLPWNLQLRVGQFLSRFGRLGSTHPHTWDFVDQPFVLGKFFGGEGNRQVGAEVSWLSPLPWFVELVASLQNAGGKATARSFYGDSVTTSPDPRKGQATFAVKQFFDLSDNWSLFGGVSLATGPNGSGRGKRTNIWGSDLYLKYRPITHESNFKLVLQAEYLLRRRQEVGDLLQDQGGYVYLLVKYAERWDSGLRYEFGSPARGRSGSVALDTLDPNWTKNRHRLTAATSYRPSEFSRFRLQASVDDPRWRNKPIYGGMFAVEFVFGAHGTHSF